MAEAPPKDDTLARWAEALNAAIASASHPLAFSATRLNRTAVRKAYEESGIDNLPDGPELLLWYSDGGLVENEPLGRCVDAVAGHDESADEARLILLVRSAVSRVPPAGDAAWAGKRHPRFTQTLVRAFDVLTAQSIDHDRLATERVNERIRSTTSVSEEIAKLIPDDGATRAALTQLLDTIREGNRSLPAGSRTYVVPPAGDVDAMTTAGLVERVLRAAGDLEGKQIADVEVVTGDSDTPGAVTGRELVDFIVRRRRQAAFDAGYSRMLGWLENAPAINTRLGGEGGSLDACQAARAQLRKRPPLTPRRARIPTRARGQMVGLLGRTVRIAVKDALSSRRHRSGAL